MRPCAFCMARDSQVIQAHAFARRGDAVGVEQTVQVQVVLAQRFAMNCERMELDLSLFRSGALRGKSSLF